MKAYSQDMRDKVIKAFNDGKSRKEIAVFFNISYETIRRWIYRYLSAGDYSSRQQLQAGRPAMFTDKEKLIEFCKKNADLTALEVRDVLIPKMSNNGFYALLKRHGITFKKRRFFIQSDAQRSDKHIAMK